MAKAKLIVTQPVPPIVQLELTEEEAKALADICMLVGGSSSTTRRRHFDDIASALCSAGVIGDDITDTNRQSIYFT